MGHQKSFSTVQGDDDFEFDEAYFRQFYKPLSNLPTPPPSSRNSSASPQSPRLPTEGGQKLNAEYLGRSICILCHVLKPQANVPCTGPAAHLARMLPPGASFMTPSVSIVQEMLARANLPMDVIALAVCILDSLTWKFSRSWRSSFPLTPSNRPVLERQMHIDSVFPEVIILGALIIATKFTEDMQEPTQYFSSVWGRGLWACEQINFTERCIMESLDYHILPLWNAKYIKQARHDIEMARRELLDEDAGPYKQNSSAKHAKSKSAGYAIVGTGLQHPPAETPRSEATSPFAQGQRQDQKLAEETGETFSNTEALPDDYLHLRLEATPL
ncbi:hypothetical protein DL768_002778 [Monosporascus sp. mg162]|nr:hypothetical protein DL768_002778 [Monosporascus sp. mg162]